MKLYETNYIKCICSIERFKHLITQNRIYEIERWLPDRRVEIKSDNGELMIFHSSRFVSAQEEEFIIQQMRLEYERASNT